MKKITLISKTDCELCDIAKSFFIKLKNDFVFDFEIVNIENETDLLKKYKYTIPIVLVDGIKRLQSKFTESDIIEVLQKC